ncbi:uncharacterized protein B0T15DRAFT_531064 [Chaetomium strumarium]|uniref:Uncharacterized protein n=1 Tax=Chaetomium strumarium TaxID=1170767 RepID=A0AAJ0GRV1_9PEZI|nr:hypothetical protein B0T15DRAFT_531064 [Chaetomium strumarium]
MATSSGHQRAAGGQNPHPQPPRPAYPRQAQANQVLPVVAAPPAPRKRRSLSWLCCGDYGLAGAIFSCLSALIALAVWLADRFKPQDDSSSSTPYAKGIYEEERYQSDVETKRLCIELKKAQAPSSDLDCERILASPFPTRHEVFESALGRVLRAPARVVSGMLTILTLLRDLVFQNSVTGVLAICVLAGLGAWLFTARSLPHAASHSHSTKSSESFKRTPSDSKGERSEHHGHQGGHSSSDPGPAMTFSADTGTRESRTTRVTRLRSRADPAHVPRDEDGVAVSAGTSSGISQRLASSTLETRRAGQSDQMPSKGSAASRVDEQRRRSPASTSSSSSPNHVSTAASTAVSSTPYRSWSALYNSAGGSDADHEYGGPTRPTNSLSDRPSETYSAAWPVQGTAPSRPEQPERPQEQKWSCCQCGMVTHLPSAQCLCSHSICSNCKIREDM